MKYVFCEHGLNYDLWENKRSLFEHFYGDFYEFILKNNGENDLKKNNINSKEDFLEFADYYAGGKENCYAMGFAFHKYFLEARMNGSLDIEKETSFIGYCLKNDKYVDFINFLVSYFAYWRNDEGCTRMDPYNYADNFFVSSWAALVDTSKLFYFSSETVYWWHSFRIKYILDHIPGVFLSQVPFHGLPDVKIAGYEFLGWFDSDKDDAKRLTSCENVQVAYAKLKRRDVYNYWEKEEKKIKKVYVDNWTKVDPE